MESEYIIVNKIAILKRIEELKESLVISEAHNDKIRAGIETFEIKQLEWCLSQSTPLIPEIERAFDESRRQHSWAGGHLYGNGYNEEEDLTDFKYKSSQDYISNLKLDI